MRAGKTFANRERNDISNHFEFGQTVGIDVALMSRTVVDEADRGHGFDSAKGGKNTPAAVDRSSIFLTDAAAAADPVPDYDTALDTMKDFLVDEYYSYFDEDWRAFDVGSDGTIKVEIADLSKAGRKLAQHAMDVWTTATGIEFKVVKKHGEIVFSNDHAFAYTDTEVDGNTITSSLINISNGWMKKYGTGIYNYTMLSFIHEMGHALGLGHSGAYGGYPPIENPPPPLDNDSWQATIMSYNSQTENDNIDADYAIPITPMMADLLAMQQLYGEMELRTGNDVYTFKADIKSGSSLTVIDSGGIDRLDFSWSTKDNVIDLHEEVFSSINGVKGNLGIMRGTVIEAAVGGTASDTIIGNDYANALYGNKGADTLTGNGGEDFFVFDTTPLAADADTITDFEIGVDTIAFNNKVYKAIGADGALTASAFVANITGLAGDAQNRVIYNSQTGDVLYDADGNGAGASVLVANVGSGLDLQSTDFLVI